MNKELNVIMAGVGVGKSMLRYGSPYDRGGADSYYRRGRGPHYYKSENGGNLYLVEKKDMTAEEIAAYNAGYDNNEEAQNHKEWE